MKTTHVDIALYEHLDKQHIEALKRIQYLEQLLKSEALLNTELSRRNTEMEQALEFYANLKLISDDMPVVNGTCKFGHRARTTLAKVRGE